MSMEYIRKTYKVPAKRGMVIQFAGHPVRILGARGAYLRVRLENGNKGLVHPTWSIAYPESCTA